jgi:hypothetical protein
MARRGGASGTGNQSCVLALPVRQREGQKREETAMADGGGGNALLGLVLGGLVVFVVMVFVFGWAGGKGGNKTVVELPTITTPR